MHIDLSFIYEYIFCRCFPHKILDVDFVFVFFVFYVAALVIESEVKLSVIQSEASEAFGSVVSFPLQDAEPLHVCQWVRDPRALREQTQLKRYLSSIVLSHFEHPLL